MASTFETGTIDPTDVAPVPADALIVPMRLAIAKGHGSALLTGLEELQEQEVRAIESEVWDRFADDPKTRLAVALDFGRSSTCSAPAASRTRFSIKASSSSLARFTRPRPSA